jgi:hypothetical protein
VLGFVFIGLFERLQLGGHRLQQRAAIADDGLE